MKKDIVNHSWISMMNRHPSSKSFIKNKIEEIENITQIVQEREGKEAAVNVLDNGRIIHSLKRMTEYLEGNSYINEDDFFIYYNYATKQAKKAEETIDSELPHLGL